MGQQVYCLCGGFLCHGKPLAVADKGALLPSLCGGDGYEHCIPGRPCHSTGSPQGGGCSLPRLMPAPPCRWGCDATRRFGVCHTMEHLAAVLGDGGQFRAYHSTFMAISSPVEQIK